MRIFYRILKYSGGRKEVYQRRMLGKLKQKAWEDVKRRTQWALAGASSMMGLGYLMAWAKVEVDVEDKAAFRAEDLNSEYREIAKKAETAEAKLSALRMAHVTTIIQQAFKDMGYDGELLFSFKEIEGYKSPAVVLMMPIYYQDKKMVEIFLSPNIHLVADREIYAIAGHEAAHIVRHHVLYKSIADGTLFASLFLAALMYANTLAQRGQAELLKVKSGFNLGFLIAIFAAQFKVAQSLLSQRVEQDADIYSAEKLGTARALSDFFSRSSQPDSENVVEDLLASHPPLKKRCEYLKPLTNQKPLLITSEKYKELRKEWQNEIYNPFSLTNWFALFNTDLHKLEMQGHFAGNTTVELSVKVKI